MANLPALDELPYLGLGISAEPGSARSGIDPSRLLRDHPGIIDFVEFGTDIERGIDEAITRWASDGGRTTYHFLDLNLEEREDADDHWLRATGEAARSIGAAWLCGDSGLWHFGARDRGHEVLLPPVLTNDSATEVAESLLRVEEKTGFRVLPENPPSSFYVGDLHLLDYYAKVADRSGGGLLLDCAHLAIYQRLFSHEPLTGFDGFPLERVIELHIAGGTKVTVDGLELIEDSHVPEPLPETWEIARFVVARAKRLRAIVYECEKNDSVDVIDNFTNIRRLLDSMAVKK